MRLWQKVVDLCTYTRMSSRQVKKKGNVIYLKCHIDICDGSEKIANGQFNTLVRRPIEYFLLLVIGRIHGAIVAATGLSDPRGDRRGANRQLVDRLNRCSSPR